MTILKATARPGARSAHDIGTTISVITQLGTIVDDNDRLRIPIDGASNDVVQKVRDILDTENYDVEVIL